MVTELMVTELSYFSPPQIYLGEENHNLCCVFFKKKF